MEAQSPGDFGRSWVGLSSSSSQTSKASAHEQRSTKVVSKPNTTPKKLHSLRPAAQHLPAGTGHPLGSPAAFGWVATTKGAIASALTPPPKESHPKCDVPHFCPDISPTPTHLMAVRLNRMLIDLNNSQRKVQIHPRDLCSVQSGSKPGEKERIALPYAAF